MMADLRLVVLLEVEQASSDALEALVDYAKAPPESTVLVIAGKGFPKVLKGQKAHGTRLRNQVKKNGYPLKLSARDVSAAQVAAEHARSLGAKLGSREARILVDLVGKDLGVVCREVEKVVLYTKADEPITEATIHAACSNIAEAAIWDLTVGLAARDPDQALTSLHRLLEDGEAAHRLLAMITWQLRTVLQVAAMVRAGKSDDAIVRATRIRYDSYRRVRSALERGYPGAADTLERIATANRSMNRHRAGSRRVLEELVLDLCT
jgi:DNA polymerase III delta subunit